MQSPPPAANNGPDYEHQRNSPTTSTASTSSPSPIHSECSPPTSPIPRVSPPSSPAAFNHSPSTSPPTVERVAQPSVQDDSSLDEPSEASERNSSSSEKSPPLKRRRNVYNSACSRSTLQRRLMCGSGADEDLDAATVESGVLNESETEDGLHAAGDNNPFQRTGSVSSGSSSTSSDTRVSSVESGSDHNIENSGQSGTSSDSVMTVSSDSDRQEENNRSISTNPSEQSIHLLYPGSDLTVDQGILKVLKLYLKEKWTKTSLDRCVKVIRSLLPKSNALPPNSVMILHRLRQVAPFESEVEHFYCSKCQHSLEEKSDSCQNCDGAESEVFFEYPLATQIKHLFEARDLASVIDRHKNRDRKDGCLSDIQDGTEYARIKSQLHGEYDIILMLNVDGVSLSKSSKQEVWTILTTICEVPPSLRASFMLLSGVYVGKVKPRMNTFLRPFVNSMKIMFEVGVTWVHPRTNVRYCSKIVCCILCADAPAKAIALNVKLFSHRYGCNVCEQKARRVELTPDEIALNEVLPGRKKKRRVRRFLFQDELPLRTGDRMDMQGIVAEEENTERKGVIGRTVLSELPFFDRAESVCAEYLHVVCLGVVKYFLNLLFCVKGAWYIGDRTAGVDSFLASIKVPDFVKRLPRGLSDLKFMIGSELRAFLLFYSLPAFQDIMTDEYYQHWMLLVGSIFILLQEYISEDDLNAAQIMLRMFVRDVSELYGEKYYTYNVHNLLHLCLLVRRWGNLWGTSAFDSEKFNGFISSHVHGTKHIGRELLSNLKIIQSVQVFERVIEGARVLPCHLLDFEFCGAVASNLDLSNAELQILSAQNISVFKLYRRAKIRSHLFTSKSYDESKKRANSYVQLRGKTFDDNGKVEYGQILYFVENMDTREVFCLISLFKVVHTKIIFHMETRFRLKHLVPVEISNQLSIVPVSHIVTKVIRAGTFLCLRPNSHEVNL